MPRCLSHALPWILAAGILLPQAARAGGDYHVLGNDDGWEVGTGTDSQGNSYCSLQENSSDQSYGLVLAIYPLGNSPSFELHLFKSDWSIPANADVPTKFLFSNGDSWSANGSAASDNGQVVDYTIGIKDMKDFVNDFAQSNSMDIQFINGTEPEWTADLTGTSRASQDLLDCTQSLIDNNGGSTQPYSTQPVNPAPQSNTQPYDNGPSGNGRTL
ncbi:hypothetical protein [Acidocella sp.]|uniref:hypothetical protein n=1 Tax=Acidocella sp. TaxID=50710 RepID=UPI00261DD90C|nr:hypothetical protein [Acidocella sp.]